MEKEKLQYLTNTLELLFPRIALYYDHLEDLQMDTSDMPKTNIQFDTWDSATFTEHGKDDVPKFKDKDLQVLWKWSHGHTCKDVGLHYMQLNRLVRKFIKETLEKHPHASQD